MAKKNFQEASLRPPVEDHQLPDEAGAPSSWAILDVRAYIADCRNATTAYGRMRNGVEIQVTFCVVRPPVVSYFCFWCPEAAHLADLGVEPIVKAAEADLIIFGVGLGSGFLCLDPNNIDIFIYHPGGGEKGPSLRLIMLDDPYCLSFNTGILRHRDITNPYDDQYHIVSLVHSSKRSWQFVLHLFDSRTESWSCQCLSVHGKENQHRQFHFSPSKAIMLGQGGLMGFVDLWRGILICDVLDCNNKSLHYLPFPRSLRDNKKLRLQPVLARDIVVVQGCIKVIDCFYCRASSAWKVSIWSLADTSVGKNWDRDYMFHVNNDLIDNSTFHLELLPKQQQTNDGNSPQQLLEALYITHPTLSLNDDKAYFMAKIDPCDKRAWVLAVDLKNKRLQDVGVFRADRSHDVTLSYIHSRISQYFKTEQGINGNLKRLGKFLVGSSCKKQAGAPRTDDVIHAQIQNGAASSTEYEDHMDLG